MSDEMRVQPFDVLLRWIQSELDANDSIFGIPRSLFYTTRPGVPFATEMFGQPLATPIGPAAGPHTQLTQNILAAWLCGGRFIELKTVQIMDELDIPRPCIDAADEGYNVEWSQELKLEQSATEYIKAWVLIHALRRLLGWDDTPFGTIFNMSVGYNLEGIQSPPMQRFMDRMKDASQEIAQLQAQLPDSLVPESPIPSQLTDNVTLSTMHGCPPDEIEAIARYMLEERGLHTYVKLNPTLLGKDAVMHILHDRLGFHEIDIPDRVFAHDLQYDRALAMIRTLKNVAAGRGLVFGVKLSNTLAMANHRGVLPGEEMYMSGRALYPVTMNLFSKLMHEFNGNLNVSYSAGADALNVATILSCGALPVTAATDLLKPGGYARLGHWLDNLAAEMTRYRATSLAELATNRLKNVERTAAEVLKRPRYQKAYHPYGQPKVDTPLDAFDCIVAPCVQQCAVLQDVPAYAGLIAQGDYDGALAAILDRNPLPGVTGYVCTHLCQSRCTRNDYEGPVLIRALKRFAAEHGSAHWGTVDSERGAHPPNPESTNLRIPRVAVIGSGPTGLSAAYYLALNGVQVTVFEARDVPGGMLAIAPEFRLPREVVREDVDRIVGLGVELKLGHPVTETPEALLEQGFDAVYIGSGFQRDASLDVEGIDGEGVYTALRFLEAVALGTPAALGEKVLVIGGGNTAMDAARTAQRLTGQPATVVYRRSRAEMPAEPDELRDLFDEGNELVELATPKRVILKDGRVVALECVRNELGAPGPDGRRRPTAIPGSEFQIPADAIILAIGQKPALTFLDGSHVATDAAGRIPTYHASRITRHARIYAGGDVTRGPAIIIQACADGRAAAEAMCAQFGVPFRAPADFATWPVSGPAIRVPGLTPDEILDVKARRARRELAHEPLLRPVDGRDGFQLVEHTLTEAQAQAEALRCVQCATVCDKCVEVCPNRANYTYLVEPVQATLPVLAVRGGALTTVGEETFAVTQGRQILHVEDLCNVCGNCATFCVHEGRPYADKPRLFLDENDYLAEEDNAFYLAGDTLRRREGGQEMRLAEQNGSYVYDDGRIRVTFSSNLVASEITLQGTVEGSVSLRSAAEMILILQGLQRSLSFLVTHQERR